MNADAYDRHRPGAECLKPTEVGLTVAPRVRLTWSVPVRVRKRLISDLIANRIHCATNAEGSLRAGRSVMRCS